MGPVDTGTALVCKHSMNSGWQMNALAGRNSESADGQARKKDPTESEGFYSKAFREQPFAL